MTIAGAWVCTPKLHHDERGTFAETFKSGLFEHITGRSFDLRQVNTSVSAAGVLRGIHYTLEPPGQAKYVTCHYGAFWDVVVDIREDSPTYRQWDAVVIDDRERRSVFLSEGLGHAILALADNSVVSYLCTSEYHRERDRDLDAFDPELAIDWPRFGRDGRQLRFSRSQKDAAAPRMSQRHQERATSQP